MNGPNPTHFLQISDFDAAWLTRVLDVAVELRDELKREGRNRPLLAQRSMAAVFEKPSLRTRVSFEVAMSQLGGHCVSLQPAEIGLGTREPAEDVAQVLSGMADVIAARVFEHETLQALASASSVPVLNGLSDLAHPCQAMADLLAIRDHFGDLKGRRITYVGDANNVSRSLAVACGRFDMPFVECAPDSFHSPDDDIARLRAQVPSLDFTYEPDPKRAVERADVIYTDTWTSMGQEAEKERRVKAFAGYSVDDDLLAAAPESAIVLHCLPAYRGLEISAEVMDSPRALVFPQAHNRLHALKALLCLLLGVADRGQ